MWFEWDDEKDRKNIAKHGIGFRTAILVFEDPNRLEMYDAVHSLDEDRYLTIGEIGGTFMVVTVVYTERPEAIRIISARRATRAEKEEYCENNDQRKTIEVNRKKAQQNKPPSGAAVSK